MSNYIEISTIDIIAEAVAKLRTAALITGIVDNNDNTYTITVSKIAYLQNNWVVSISNTPNFNGDYIVSNLAGNVFDISLAKGKTISTFGTMQPITPIFYFEKWAGAQNEILQNAIDYVSNFKKFPCCLMLLDITENFEKPYIVAQNLKIYFFENTDELKNSAWRHANTMPKLRYLYSNFINELSYNNKVVGDFTHTKTERFYLGTADKNQNKLGSIVDAIEINISNLKLMNSNLNCNY